MIARFRIAGFIGDAGKKMVFSFAADAQIAQIDRLNNSSGLHNSFLIEKICEICESVANAAGVTAEVLAKFEIPKSEMRIKN